MGTDAKNQQYVAQLASHVPGRIRIKLHHSRPGGCTLFGGSRKISRPRKAFRM